MFEKHTHKQYCESTGPKACGPNRSTLLTVTKRYLEGGITLNTSPHLKSPGGAAGSLSPAPGGPRVRRKRLPRLHLLRPRWARPRSLPAAPPARPAPSPAAQEAPGPLGQRARHLGPAQGAAPRGAPRQRLPRAQRRREVPEEGTEGSRGRFQSQRHGGAARPGGGGRGRARGAGPAPLRDAGGRGLGAGPGGGGAENKARKAGTGRDGDAAV